MNGNMIGNWFQNLTKGVPKRIVKKLILNYVIWTSVFIILSGMTAIFFFTISASDDKEMYIDMWLIWSAIIAYGNYKFLKMDFEEERKKQKCLGL